jgi:dihydroorotase
VLDATGMLILPGLVDMHVHLREPGYEYKETIATGVKAALAGGFTSLACMANTEPVNDSAAVTQFIIERARIAGGARVYPIGALSLGLKGERLAEIGEMHRAGIVAVSDDGRPVMHAGLMRRALEYTRMFDLPVIAHEDDAHLADGGVMNEGATALRLGLRGTPAAAEEVMIARDVALVRLTGGRLHLAHISTVGAVALVREAKAQGLAVTAEVTPHHLFLTEEAVEGYGTDAKMAPPLRTRADVDALRAALADGTIDAIATDHAPHHRDEKEVEFEAAANGVVGLETALPLALRLVAEGVADLPTIVARMTVGPARILGLPAGTLAPGADADLTLVDPARRWRVDARSFRSKGRNTPFEGWDVVGRTVAVLVGGRLVHEERAPAAPLRSQAADEAAPA